MEAEISAVESMRLSLRSLEIHLPGGVNEKDAAVLEEIDGVVSETCAELSAVFALVFGDKSNNPQFADMMRGIYGFLGKGWLRYTKKHKRSLTRDDLDLFWNEIQQVSELFSKYGICVDDEILKRVMAYHGFQYWNEFFKSEEYTPFKDTPWIIRHAILRHPTNSRQFMKDTEDTVKAILKEDKFAGFVKMPSLVRYAVVKYARDPRKFLEGVSDTVDEILAEAEFKQFNDGSRWIVGHAVAHYPKNPRKFLREVIGVVAQILLEAEFAGFKRRRAIVRYAAVSNPSDPRAFLRNLPSWAL